MNKEKTIRSSIRQGNMLILAGGLFLAIFFSIALIYLSNIQQTAIHYSDNLAVASDAIIEADGLYHLVDSLVYGDSRQTTIDLSTPTFDTLCGVSATDPIDITKGIKSAQKIYKEFKLICDDAMLANGGYKPNAQAIVDEELEPVMNDLINALNSVTKNYVALNTDAGAKVNRTIILTIVIGAIFLVFMLIYSLRISSTMGKHIADPVVQVTEWAETLSTGADDIEIVRGDPNQELAEIKRMVNAFTTMSDGIKDNVDIIRKVASGDMTAYVNIRSNKDSLGKSLYKMVQSNDIMFAQITQIADSVTDGTDSIAAAARHLAESCTEQAEAISNFEHNISETNELVKENAVDAAQASSLSDDIRNEVILSKEKMQELVAAMKAINTASAKVSGVISNIESLANQTNLLAINATIEAKRAGEAGKSFAVVASSVKDLADKSAVSAAQTKELINDTIEKAQLGSQLSDETYGTFETIMSTLEQIINVSGKIADSGAKQQAHMNSIEHQVNEISRSVTNNAESSERTAAMTVEISQNAEVLKAAMKQFHLRNRKPGKPYIPPEKITDADFIRVATANYDKFVNSPAGRKMQAEMNTTKI